MLVPATDEHKILQKIIQDLEEVRKTAEDAVIELNGAPQEQAAITAGPKAKCRRLAKEVAKAGTKLRMLVKDGAKMTNAVFTPNDGYEDLDEEEVKRLKEEKK